MDTLRVVSPKPSVRPKRDFVKENVMRVKEAQVKRGPSANGTTKPTLSSPKDQIVVIKAASENSNKGAGSVSLTFESNIAATSASRSSVVSTTREMASQTGDVNDDLFLKDVIIRMPSAKVLDQLKRNGSARRTVSNRREKSVVFKWDETGSGGRKPVDEFEQQRNAHLARLEEFFRKKSVSRSKEFDDSTEFSASDQIYVRNYRQLTAMRKKQAAAKRESQMHQQQQDSPVYEEHKPIETVSSHSFRSNNYIRNGTPSSSTGSSRTTTSKMDVPASYRVGELPKYLKKMKQDTAERHRVMAEIDSNCPEGHVALSEDERIEVLEIASESFQHLNDELNNIPLTSQTLHMIHRKMKIEKELKQIKEHIRFFSQLKVYVKIDE